MLYKSVHSSEQIIHINPKTLMSTTEDILPFYKHLHYQLLNVMFQSLKTDKCRDLNFINSTNFQSLEVVARGSETQFLVTEN